LERKTMAIHRVRVPATALMITTMLGLSAAQAEDQAKPTSAAGDTALVKKLEQMEQRIRSLEDELKQKDARTLDGAYGQATASARAKPTKGAKEGARGPKEEAKEQRERPPRKRPTGRHRPRAT
jgi:hypothetical protein